jgi:hypothetical protein
MPNVPKVRACEIDGRDLHGPQESVEYQIAAFFGAFGMSITRVFLFPDAAIVSLWPCGHPIEDVLEVLKRRGVAYEVRDMSAGLLRVLLLPK